MNRALDSILAGPRHHAASGRSVFDAAEPHLAEKLHTGCSQFLEVIFDHALLENRSPGVNPHASGTKRLERTLREDRHCLESDDVLWASGCVDFSCGNHGGHTAVQAAI